MNNNILTAEGFDSDKVGNFLQKIRKLKKLSYDSCTADNVSVATISIMAT